jgi:MFS transporter, ACS family, glucarate transporter
MSTVAPHPTPVAASARPTRVRHAVLWLTVAAYLITYMDRAVIATAMPYIQKEFGFTTITTAWILSAFSWGYALFQIPGGWLGDRIGPRRALSLIVCWWSFFTCATAFCWNAASMVVTRFLFGVGEAGAFPNATRSLSRWILPSERGYAQGVTHAGSRLGGAVTPPLVVWLVTVYGWRSPFLIFGMVGFAWAAVWYFWYRDTPREHRSVNAAELDLIHASTGERSRTSKSVPWRAILKSRTVWYLSAMYFCYGYSFALFLQWFPTYLRNARGFSPTEMGTYTGLILLTGMFGNLAGGWASDHWLKKTGQVARARNIMGFVGFAVAAAAIVPAALTQSPVTCVSLSCISMFGLEFTIAASWAVPLDIGGDCAGSVSAVMNTCGNIGAAIAAAAIGYLVQHAGWQQPFFVNAALCTTAALLYLKIDASRRIEFVEQ